MRLRWIATFVVLVGCTRAPAPPPRPTTVPPEVVAVLSLPSLDRSLTDALAFAAQVAPREGAALGTQLAGYIDLDAVDRARPFHLIVVTPAAAAATPDVVLVAAARDPARLARSLGAAQTFRTAHGWTAIGPAAALDRVGPWGLGTLAVGAAPARPSATVYPAAILARWGDVIRAELGDDSRSLLMAPMREAVLGLLAQSERIEAHADLAAGEITIDLAVTARPGSTLAAVLAAQRPATFALFERLPQPSFNAMAGHLRLGPLAAPVRALVDTAMTAEVGELSASSRALLDTVWDAGTGEFGGVTLMGSGRVVNALGATDAARLRAPLEALARAISARPQPEGGGHFVLDPPVLHHGVPTSVLRMVAPDMPDVLAFSWAAWDDIVVLGMPDPDGAAARAAIDGQRAAPAMPPTMARVLADARARGDSALQIMDVRPDDGPPIVLAFGVHANVGRLRAQLPAPQVAAALGLAQLPAAP